MTARAIAGLERAWIGMGAALLLLVVGRAHAATASGPRPGTASHAEPPAAMSFLSPDSTRLTGTWYSGPKGAPVLVLVPRGRRPDPGLDSLALLFQQRGFSAMTFALRDPAPADAEKDSLRYLILASRWVEDVVGALRAARARSDSTMHLFVWGQGMGGVLAVAAIARIPGVCDALAAEQLYRTTDDAMKLNGTFVIPEAIQIRNLHLYPPDEPISAAARLNIPALAVLTGPDAGTPRDLTLQVLSRDRGRVERWKRPWIATTGLTPTPADADTLAAWFTKWTRYPRAR